jgi:S1-C subfamily serine protease
MLIVLLIFRPFHVSAQTNKGDFRVKQGSLALAAGFKNFDMDRFGVVSEHLRKLAQKVPVPNDVVLEFNGKKINTVRDLMEARMSVIGTKADVVVFRNQQEMKTLIELDGKR